MTRTHTFQKKAVGTVAAVLMLSAVGVAAGPVTSSDAGTTVTAMKVDAGGTGGNAGLGMAGSGCVC